MKAAAGLRRLRFAMFVPLLRAPVPWGTAVHADQVHKGFINRTRTDEARTMKTLTTLINVIAFSALFTAYAGGMSMEKPTGVRRALQTYAGQLPTGTFPTLKPVWQIGVDASDLV